MNTQANYSNLCVIRPIYQHTDHTAGMAHYTTTCPTAKHLTFASSSDSVADTALQPNTINIYLYGVWKMATCQQNLQIPSGSSAGQ